jgi:4-hydroxybenzoate polyprenyltransferase/phosphoserine phosphatase
MSENSRLPLFVDLDHTLIRTDTLVESLFLHLKRKPFILFLLPFWLLRGRAYLKARLAEGTHLDAAHLPYNSELCDDLRRQAAAGRSIYLASASHRALAEQVARHLGFFTSVLASEGEINLKGRRKLVAIQAQAPRGFDYAGDSRADLPIWRAADKAIVVGASPAFLARVRACANVEQAYPSRNGGWLTYLKAIRAYQWMKNLLIFVPLLTTFQFTDPAALAKALVAFVALSLCASANYLVNDLLDLQADRKHPRKCKRPFASGAVPLAHGLVLAPLLLIGGLALAATVSLFLAAAVMAYVVVTSVYSLALKEYFLADTLLLASLYTFRILVGSVAIGVKPSFWILAFSMFLFLSLALVKRCSELKLLATQSVTHTKGRDYRASDLDVLYPMGIASGFLAVQVFALYINAEEVSARYQTPEALWTVCIGLLYWMGRMWFKTGRGEMHDDPLVFALKDRTSLLTILLMVCASLFAYFIPI